MTHAIFDTGNGVVVRVENRLFLPYKHENVLDEIKTYLKDNGIPETEIIIPEKILIKYGSQI